MNQFHPPQVEAADTILSKIKSADSLSMVLLAQMQSGKTGTYLKVALDAVDQNLVTHVMILSGSRDTSLRSQTKQDVKEAIRLFCTEGNGGRQMTDETKKKQLKSAIHVYWSQDLKDISEVSDSTLIIHDESHAAQSKHNRPFVDFYKKHKLDRVLCGDNSQIKGRHIYLLNVSATPFSEIICDKLTDQLSDTYTRKEFVLLKPDKHYIGIQTLLDHSIKFEAKKVNEKTSEHFQTILQKNKSKYNNSYCIVRTHGAYKDQSLIESIASKYGYDYKSIFATKQNESTHDLKLLETKPNKPTVVHICGKARMGQVLCKDHIGMVYEQAEKPNTDTILQGLLGRMCGYVDTKHVDIYLSKVKQDEIETYAESWESLDVTQLTRIKQALNLHSCKCNQVDVTGDVIRHEGQSWIKIVPVRLKLNEVCGSLSWKEFTQKSDKIKHIIDILSKKPKEGDIPLILKELHDILSHPEKHLGYRTSTSKSYQEFRYLERFSRSSENRIRDSVDYHESNPLQLVGCNKEFNPDNTVFLIGYIKHNVVEHGNALFDVPRVDERCNYNPYVVLPGGLEVPNFNGGQLIKFPFNKTADNLITFKQTLRKFIERTLPTSDTYIEGCQRSITSMFDEKRQKWIGIYLSKQLVNAKKIREIEAEFNKSYAIQLKFTKHKGSTQKKGYKQFDRIEW